MFVAATLFTVQHDFLFFQLNLGARGPEHVPLSMQDGMSE